MSNKLTGYAAISAVEKSDHSGGKPRTRSGVSKDCVAVGAVGLAKNAERSARIRARAAYHASAEARRSSRTHHTVGIAGRAGCKSVHAGPAIDGITDSQHSLA